MAAEWKQSPLEHAAVFARGLDTLSNAPSAAHIKKAYPRDEATGFDIGDLRGVFWVEYPSAK